MVIEVAICDIGDVVTLQIGAQQLLVGQICVVGKVVSTKHTDLTGFGVDQIGWAFLELSFVVNEECDVH